MKVNGSLNKSDLIRLYSSHYNAFSQAVEPIKQEIGWREGKQRFYTRQIQIIVEHLGPPVLSITTEAV